jgi:hypothetical protein
LFAKLNLNFFNCFSFIYKNFFNLEILSFADTFFKLVIIFLYLVVGCVGFYFAWITIVSIMTRDNMNYQEYDWYFDPNSAPTSTTTTTTDPWASTETTYGTCVGDACCSDGLVYDSSLNQCITPNGETTTTTTTETFVNNVFTKPTNNYKKPDVVLGSDNIKSNNSKSFINNSKF